MKPKTNSLYIGKAGEYRVASELMLRGYGVLMAIVDNGIDLVTDNNLHIQVKTSNRRTGKSRNPNWGDRQLYNFSLDLHRRRRGDPKWKVEIHPLTGVDFVICWAIDDNDFYIIPVQEVRGVHGIIINGNKYNRIEYGRNRWLRYRNNWDVLKGIMPEKPKAVDKDLVIKLYSDGYTLDQIGVKLDIPNTSVRRVVLKNGVMRSKMESRSASYKLEHGVDRDEIITKLYGQGLAIKDISSEVGLSVRAISEIIRRLSIPKRQNRKTAEELESSKDKIQELYQNGYSVGKISETLKISYKTVYRLASRMGIIRSQSEAVRSSNQRRTKSNNPEQIQGVLDQGGSYSPNVPSEEVKLLPCEPTKEVVLV